MLFYNRVQNLCMERLNAKKVISRAAFFFYLKRTHRQFSFIVALTGMPLSQSAVTRFRLMIIMPLVFAKVFKKAQRRSCVLTEFCKT